MAFNSQRNVDLIAIKVLDTMGTSHTHLLRTWKVFHQYQKLDRNS